MRLHINGIKQDEMIKNDLTIEDTFLLSYIKKFVESGNMKELLINGSTYYWLNYTALLEELPVLRLKKDSLYRRLKKLVDKGILKHKTVRDKGTWSYYSFGEIFNSLLYTDNGSKVEGVRIESNSPIGTEVATKTLDFNNNLKVYNTKQTKDVVVKVNCNIVKDQKKEETVAGTNSISKTTVIGETKDMNNLFAKLNIKNINSVKNKSSAHKLEEIYSYDEVEKAIEQEYKGNVITSLNYVHSLVNSYRKSKLEKKKKLITIGIRGAKPFESVMEKEKITDEMYKNMGEETPKTKAEYLAKLGFSDPRQLMGHHIKVYRNMVI